MVTPAKVVQEMQGLDKKDDVLDVIRKHCMKFKPVSSYLYTLFLQVFQLLDIRKKSTSCSSPR